MENNESTKPQPTGGLKLMTVFIAVLALHVFVIGGITVYHLMNGSASDSDLAIDKTHKSVKASSDGDAPLPDADKNTTASTPSTDSNPAPTQASTPQDSPAPANVPQEATQTVPPSVPAPVVAPSTVATAQTPSGPVQSETAANPPVEPSTMVSSGPVQMPVIPMTAQTEPVGSTPYVVKPHDSLAKIAHHHHITVAKLKAANGLNSDLLQIGQKLVIPSKGVVAFTGPSDGTTTPTILDDSAPVTPKVAKAAKATHVAPKAIAASNPASPGHKFYTVVKGDTLVKIAHKFKTTPNAIMAVNALGDAGKLSIGQKLRIPSKESRSATNVTPAPAVPTTPAAAGQPAPQDKTTAQLANFIR